MSADTMCSPSRPLRISRNSRVDQPPVSGVPVAGANAGSMESICGVRQRRLWPVHAANTYIDREVDGEVAHGVSDLLHDAGDTYTAMFNTPVRCGVQRRTWYVPRVSISRASMRWKPVASSLR